VTVPSELDETMHTMHRLWTRAVGTPEYDKEEWKTLERGIYALGKELRETRKDVARWKDNFDSVEDVLRECADACDELRNTLSYPLPACVTRARALLGEPCAIVGRVPKPHDPETCPGCRGANVTPACTCGEWTEENPIACPRHDTPEEAERVRQLLLATARKVIAAKECGAKDPAGWGGTCIHPPHGAEREHQYQSTRKAKHSDVTHILEAGMSLCRFTTVVPGDWPPGNYWVRLSEAKEASCPGCRTRAAALGRST